MRRFCNVIFSLILFIFIYNSYAQPVVKADSLRLRVQRIASSYIDPDGKIKSYYSVDGSGVATYASYEDKLSNKPECKIYWEELLTFRQLVKKLPNEELLRIYQTKRTTRFPDSLNQFAIPQLKFSNEFIPVPKPLKGLRIALDPGHVSGDIETAISELKYLKLKKDSLMGLNTPIELIEGNLTLATSLFLKKLLEDAGAEIMLTRDKPNYSSFGVAFDEWLYNADKKTFEEAHRNGDISLEEKNRFVKYRAAKDIFQNYFRFADLYERAKIINRYRPDFTVIIHYNVDETNKPWTSPTSKNFNMVFVPGDVKPTFLRKIENRFELLRMLTSTDLEESVKLGSKLVQSFEHVLKVPIALPHQAKYLREDCTTTGNTGVYVRNLALTRLIRGPVAYGETLYQDNINECHLLSDLTLEVGEVKTSERVRQVAQSYYEGIMNYVLKLNKP